MKFLITMMALIMSFSTFAADGSSGCGPGWYLFKDTSLVSSAFRATTNGFLFPTTTIGMTIGSSNCSQHKIVLKEKEALHYAINNYHELQSEAVMAQGEFLTSFANVIGCQGQIQEIFNNELQKNYNKVFKSADKPAESMLIEVYKIILTNEALTRSCSLS